jgi:AraC-like DNA-binding protein
VLQGEKEVSAGKHKVRCGQGHMILVTHQLPVVSKIVKASGIDPYIAVILPLDQEKLLRYYEPTKSTRTENTNVAMACHEADPAILTALGRLLTLANEPEIAPLVAPLVEDEIHARLLHSSIGARLVRLMWHDDKSAHIARVIKLISDDLANNLSIPELADTVGLSKSALHLHFKAVTGMSPLAYSKELRLLKAQTFVRESNRPISMIGYDVGYESPAQFSREYARKFDLTPRQDRLAFR